MTARHPRLPWLHRLHLAAWTGLPLAANALCYLTWRDESLWCFRWVEALGAEAPVAALRQAAAGLGDPGEFVRFSLASGLWILGVTSFLVLVLRERRRDLFAWSGSLLLLCLASEALQAVGRIPGTADPADALAYVGGFLLALRLHHDPAVAPAATPVVRAHLACTGVVAGALLLATGAIYRGALDELASTWLG